MNLYIMGRVYSLHSEQNIVDPVYFLAKEYQREENGLNIFKAEHERLIKI